MSKYTQREWDRTVGWGKVPPEYKLNDPIWDKRWKVIMMKVFKHQKINLPEIKAKTTDGVRLYETPDGNFYPSITTVLSTRNKEGLFKWRERVGNDVANYVARTAAVRGTYVHHMCEDYLNNDFDEEKHKKKFLPYTLFTQLRDSVLQKIDNIYAQECGLYSDKYKVAGRVDCIAEYDGIPSIIDFKTSTSERKDSYNENYYIQASAYAEMFEERTGDCNKSSCNFSYNRRWCSPRVCKG